MPPSKVFCCVLATALYPLRRQDFSLHDAILGIPHGPVKEGVDVSMHLIDPADRPRFVASSPGQQVAPVSRR